jgi:hypothetical protein
MLVVTLPTLVIYQQSTHLFQQEVLPGAALAKMDGAWLLLLLLSGSCC